MPIPLVIWAVGALGAAAWGARTFDDPFDIFTGETAEDKLRKQVEQEGKLVITNPPMFPPPSAPSAAQLEAMKGSGAGDVTWTPLSLQAADQQAVAEYKRNYEPVIATVGGQPKIEQDPIVKAALIAGGVGLVVLVLREFRS